MDYREWINEKVKTLDSRKLRLVYLYIKGLLGLGE